MSVKTKIANDKTMTMPVIRREGDEIAFAVRVVGATTITADGTLTMAMFKVGSTTDVSSTYFTGSMSVSGAVIISKTTTSLKQGEYVVSIKATVDGQLRTVATIPFTVKRRGEL